jgi:hypothetical protein
MKHLQLFIITLIRELLKFLFIDIMIEIEFAQTSRHRYKVYGWKNVYTLSNAEAKAMPVSYDGSYYANKYGNQANSYYNKNYAYTNGLPSLACPLGVNYYNYYNIFK